MSYIAISKTSLPLFPASSVDLINKNLNSTHSGRLLATFQVSLKWFCGELKNIHNLRSVEFEITLPI